MGKHNLDEGKDELIRAILLMKYDTKKTLTENQEKIKPLIKEDIPGTAVGGALVGAGVGARLAATGMLPGTASVAGLGTVGVTGVGAVAEAVGGFLGIGLTGGAAVLGGAAALALAPLVYWLVTKDNGSNRVKTYFDFCSSSADKVAKLKRKLNEGEIRDIADKINDAVNYSTWGFMAGTDEESLFSAFKSIATGTASDVCALLQYYNRQYGDLWDDLDSDIDSESEWNQIYRPIRNCVEDSMKELEDVPKKQCPTDKPYLNVNTNECESKMCGGCVLLICPDGNPIPANGKCSSKTDNIPVVTSKCPVGNGTRQEVIDFQTYVVNTIKDTSILGRYGANKDGIDGICGPNTKKAWNMYKSKYENKTGSDATTTNPDEDEDSIADDNMSDIDN